MGKILTPNFSAGFAPSAPPPKLENKTLMWTTYARNSSPLALTFSEIFTIRVENLTPNFGEGFDPSAPNWSTIQSLWRTIYSKNFGDMGGTPLRGC